MIFYFSGTGNSLYAAKSIAGQINEELVSISAAVNSGKGQYEYSLEDQETVGFVFPVYAWGPPQMVLDFIEKLKLNNLRDNYVFAVVTCGDNIGNTLTVLSKHLKKKSLALHSGYSVIMPNNYILMGNVDPKELEQKKLSSAEETLKAISKSVAARERGAFKVVKGALPWLLTGVVHPLFSKYAADTSKFSANDNCTGCGICAKVCNSNSIKVNDKPHWGKACTQCLACIHYCPTGAIQCGKGTEKKGRYTNPKISVEEIAR